MSNLLLNWAQLTATNLWLTANQRLGEYGVMCPQYALNEANKYLLAANSSVMP